MKTISYRKLLIAILSTLAVLFLLQLSYYVIRAITIRSNHDKVMNYIDTELTLSPDTLESSEKYINKWLESSFLSNEDKGRLYERASLIYFQLGKDMTYYRYLGYALYYLERSPDKDFTINIYLDLANFHLNNYAYDAAEEMIDKALSVKPFEDIGNLQIKSYAFRMLALMDIYHGNYQEAEEEMIRSQEIVDQSHTNVFEDGYRAINDMYLARVYIEQGRYPEAEALLDKQKDSPFFELLAYREIFLRDFIIPYYQNRCYLEVATNYSNGIEDTAAQLKTAQTTIEDFIQLCTSEGYEKIALNTLLELQKKYPTDNVIIIEEMVNKMRSLYTTLFDVQNKSYASIITSQVNDSKAAMEEEEKLNHANSRKTQLIVVSAILIIVVLSMGISIILNSRYDALTQLFNRKQFNRSIEQIIKSENEYAVVMLDIDNFKGINDTYGHICGDSVLQKLGKIISNEMKTDCNAYRYGGEEFTILITKHAVKDAEMIAEKIRRSMEAEKWDFDPEKTITVSLGISKGSGPSLLKQADDNLYQAKHNGKNMVYSG